MSERGGETSAAGEPPEWLRSRPAALRTDGGNRRDKPLDERSRESIESEIEELEQNPTRYETRDQSVIDRYEGLLAERNRRQQAESSRENGDRQRLRRIKNRVLRALGLR